MKATPRNNNDEPEPLTNETRKIETSPSGKRLIRQALARAREASRRSPDAEPWVKPDGTDSGHRAWITIDGREHEILVNALLSRQHELRSELDELQATGTDDDQFVELEIDEHEALLQKIHDAPATDQ